MADLDKTVADALRIDFYNHVQGIVLTEKFSRLIEFENKLVFEIVKETNKSTLKVLVENEFGEKVNKINVLNDHKGIKKAIVQFTKEGVASEIASKLGIM